MRAFLKEVANGGYTHLCLSFLPSEFESAKRQCELTRAEAPHVTIVATGLGSAIDEVANFVDYVSSVSAVGFLRNLLGEVVGAPIINPMATYQSSNNLGEAAAEHVFVTGFSMSTKGNSPIPFNLFNGFSIPHIDSARTIYEQMMERVGSDCANEVYKFFLIEEDFFADFERVNELAQYLANSEVFILFSCFATADSLSRFSMEELVAMGLDTVWLPVDHMNKSLRALFADLQKNGIKTVAFSLMAKEDQNEEKIISLIDYQLGLEATFNQFSLDVPMPGCRAYEQCRRQGRLLGRPWSEFDGWHYPLDHQFLSSEDVEYLQQYACHKDFLELGPSILRALSVALDGWLVWRDSDNERCQERAKHFGRILDGATSIFSPALAFSPSPHVRQWIEKLERNILVERGGATLSSHLRALFYRLRIALGEFWSQATGRTKAFRVSMRRKALRSLKYELKLVSLREDLLDAIQPYVEHWNEFTANRLDGLGSHMDKLNELRRTGSHRIGEYIEQLQSIREQGIDYLNSEPFALLRTDAVSRLNAHIEHLRQLRYEGYEKLHLHVEYLTALRDETVDALQTLKEQLLELKEQGEDAVLPYLEQLDVVRQNGTEAVQSYIEQVSELRAQGMEAVAVEIRGFMNSKDFQALREKIEPLVTAGRPIILYASHQAPIDSREFEWVAQRIRRMFADNAVLPIVGGVCQQLAVVEPLRIIS